MIRTICTIALSALVICGAYAGDATSGAVAGELLANGERPEAAARAARRAADREALETCYAGQVEGLDFAQLQAVSAAMADRGELEAMRQICEHGLQAGETDGGDDHTNVQRY